MKGCDDNFRDESAVPHKFRSSTIIRRNFGKLPAFFFGHSMRGRQHPSFGRQNIIVGKGKLGWINFSAYNALVFHIKYGHNIRYYNRKCFPR